MSNPLLNYNDLPPFAAILPEHIGEAVDTVLSDARACVEAILKDQNSPTWDNFVTPLTLATERIGQIWGPVSHLHAVKNTPELREAYNNNLPKISAFYSKLGQNLELYKKYKILFQNAKSQHLNSTRLKVLDNALRDFRLSGAELDEAKKPRFTEIQLKLAELSSKFSQNLLDATDDFSLLIQDKNELAGIPDDVLDMFAHAAQADGKTGYKINLQIPFYLPVMQYAENRNLREKLYKAYVTRASEFGKKEWNNAPIIREILKLRAEEAKTLGFENFATLSLDPKMAESPKQVIDFLKNLAQKAKPFAQKDRADLEKFATENSDISTLEAWDIAFFSEKLREKRYQFSEQEVKRYFPENKVISGLFALVKKLYNIDIKPLTGEFWHPDVRFFAVEKNGALIGQFWFDLYARAQKRGGAWMDDARGRYLKSETLQLPVAYMVCNFSAPVGDKPALLTHDEVLTLFHEFGHGLHHLLTQVDELAVSGINGVEWDAVELPSQFMENFCWEWEVVQSMSAHVDHGEPLPRELFDKMLAAKNYQSGMQTVRQIEFALFDMLLHSDFDAQHGDWQALLDEVRAEVAVNIPPSWNRFANSFSHIFAGGYAAGYYSYKWAEVLSADVYAAFEENDWAQVGERFWREILSMGGARSALESFRAFRGRDPEIDALLRHHGMIENET